MAEADQSLTVWAKSIQTRLSQAYEESRSMLTHAGLKGSVREAIIRDILRGFLPTSVEIGTGQIIDSQGNRSKQVDVVVARGNTPAFRFEGDVSVFLIETVLSTIEVKSMLDRERLAEALDNSWSVKRLSYLARLRSPGPALFEKALRWIHENGGLERVAQAVFEPSQETALEAPHDVRKAIQFALMWLYWVSGHFGDQRALGLRPLIGNAEFDLFANLLARRLRTEDAVQALTTGFQRADEVRDGLFKDLYDNLTRDYLPPTTIVLAYRGYENLRQLIEEVMTWYDQHRAEVEWDSLPKLIMNHKMLMFRHFNEYHCVVFPYPVLFLVTALTSSLGKDLSYQVSFDAETNLTTYFDIGRILGDAHPQYSADYLVWSIPFDRSLKGKIIEAPAGAQRRPPGGRP